MRPVVKDAVGHEIKQTIITAFLEDFIEVFVLLLSQVCNNPLFASD